MPSKKQGNTVIGNDVWIGSEAMVIANQDRARCGDRQPLVDDKRCGGTVAKVSDGAAFVLFKGLTFQKLCLRAHFARGITIINAEARPLRSARITSIPLMVA